MRRAAVVLLERFPVVRSEEGQDLLEYALLMALIAITALAAVAQVGQVIRTVFWDAIASFI